MLVLLQLQLLLLLLASERMTLLLDGPLMLLLRMGQG